MSQARGVLPEAPKRRAALSRARRTAGAARTIEGSLDGGDLSIGVVASRFNDEICRPLLEGALAALRRHGVSEDRTVVVRVPGAFEIPTAARHLARSKRWDAIVCVGAVIRGETPHFDWVAGEAARGISSVALETGVPVLFGLVTVNTVEQARDRAGGRLGNRGSDAAEAAIEMAHVTRALTRKRGR